MSVLKEPLAVPSRFRGIYRYLLQTKGQRENLETLGKLISPDQLVKDKPSERPMFQASLKESLKCELLIKEQQDNQEEIMINPDLPEEAKDKHKGDLLLPNTLALLFFASNNEDEYDFGLVCAWFLAQNIYKAPGNWEEVQKAVYSQKVDEFIKMSNSTLHGQMEHWMNYLGLAWTHALDKKPVMLPDPTVYIRRNLKYLFDTEGETLLLKELIKRLAQRCPLFETGHFREKIEEYIGQRNPNYLSTSTAFALFRLQDEGYIQLFSQSDAELMLLPKANNEIDEESRVSHITYLGD